MRGLPFSNDFNKFNYTVARMLDSINHIRIILKSYFGVKNVRIVPYA